MHFKKACWGHWTIDRKKFILAVWITTNILCIWNPIMNISINHGALRKTNLCINFCKHYIDFKYTFTIGPETWYFVWTRVLALDGATPYVLQSYARNKPWAVSNKTWVPLDVPPKMYICTLQCMCTCKSPCYMLTWLN